VSEDQRAQLGVIYVAGLILTVGAGTFNILPLLTAGAVDTLGFSERQAGVMSLAISVGSGASALLAVMWVRTARWRRAAVIALSGMVAADTLAILFHNYWVFVLLQGAAGFFGTAVICLSLTILSDFHESARGFGLSNAMQVVYQISTFLAGPILVRWAGLSGLLGLLAVLGVLAITLTPLVPVHGRVSATGGVSRKLFKASTLLGLLGFGMFFLNAGAYWTYVQIIGETSGMSSRLAANCVAAGISGGILGGAAAWFLGDRFGRLWPLVISCVMTVGAALLLRNSFGIAAFVSSVLLYFFAWNYSVAYQLSIVSTVDTTGRGVALTQVFVFIGAAAGAGLAALFVSPSHYTAVTWLACGGACVSTVLFAAAIALFDMTEGRRPVFGTLS
jgi:predicted MFS family arabinose efflux permease